MERGASGSGEDRRYSGPRASGDRSSDDVVPPHSRLFVVCGKGRTSDDLRPVFEKYGTIEDIFVVKDRQTGESKGVCYVKYDRTSSAALAQEGLNDTVLEPESKPIRVMIAAPKTKQPGYDVNDEKSRNRLFVVLPKGSGDKELRSAFSGCKDYDTAYIVQDWKTNEPKGFGFVQFNRASSAALAMESCDSSFRAVIAEPKDAARDRSRGASGGGHSSQDVSSMVYPPLPPMGGQQGSSRYSSGGGSYGGNDDGGMPTRLYIIVDTCVSQDQLARLCDIAPGMEHCDLKMVRGTSESRGFAFVTYESAASARFAKERLSCVEYPPGNRLVVKYAMDHPRSAAAQQQYEGGGDQRSSRYRGSSGGHESSGPAYRDHYSEDPSMVAGGRGGYHDGEYGGGEQHHHETMRYDSYAQGEEIYGRPPPATAAAAPPRRSSGEHDFAADQYSESAAHTEHKPSPSAGAVDPSRLFFVGTPSLPPESVLRSVFGHFGSFVDAYVVRGHNYGYARYGDETTAQLAIKHLNGSEVVGNKLKVMLADPAPRADEPSAKRTRV
eukprot:scpid51784/ scgid31593/ RNA-binding protein 45; Developmentally-regulated RNA-binding protein 1; RNA-binding motif protein 45